MLCLPGKVSIFSFFKRYFWLFPEDAAMGFLTDLDLDCNYEKLWMYPVSVFIFRIFLFELMDLVTLDVWLLSLLSRIYKQI